MMMDKAFSESMDGDVYLFSREGRSISTIYVYCSKDKSVPRPRRRVQCDQHVPWWLSAKRCHIWGSVLVSAVDRSVTLGRSFLGKVHGFGLLHSLRSHIVHGPSEKALE